MRLLELFLARWEECGLEQALKLMEEEIENRFGVISDENKIQNAFFPTDKYGRMVENDAFWECMELLSLTRELADENDVLPDLYIELRGWKESNETEYKEEVTNYGLLAKLELLIGKINCIPRKKRLILLMEKDGVFQVAENYSLEEYQNGRTSFTDIHVRAMILNNITENFRLLVLAGKGSDIHCVEVTFDESELLF